MSMSHRPEFDKCMSDFIQLVSKNKLDTLNIQFLVHYLTDENIVQRYNAELQFGTGVYLINHKSCYMLTHNIRTWKILYEVSQRLLSLLSMDDVNSDLTTDERTNIKFNLTILDINYENDYGLTLLSKTITNFNLMMGTRLINNKQSTKYLNKIQWLIDHGANVNHINKHGKRIFDYAIYYPEVVMLLYKNGLKLPPAYDSLEMRKTIFKKMLTKVNFMYHNEQEYRNYIRFIYKLDILFVDLNAGNMEDNMKIQDHVLTERYLFNDYISIDDIYMYQRIYQDVKVTCPMHADLFRIIFSSGYMALINNLIKLDRDYNITHSSLPDTKDSDLSDNKSGILDKKESIVRYFDHLCTLEDDNGNTALHLAIIGDTHTEMCTAIKNDQGNPILIDKLITMGLNIHKPNKDGITPYYLLKQRPELFKHYNSHGLTSNMILYVETLKNDDSNYFSYLVSDLINYLRRFLTCN